MKAKPFPKSSDVLQPPQNFPPPLPLPPLQLQNLISNRVNTLAQETTPKHPPKSSPSSQEVLHYPKSTTKSKPPVFDIHTMKEMSIPIFDLSRVPEIHPETDCNDDLFLGSFKKSNYIWAGAQKKGTLPSILESKDYLDHIRQAMEMEFPLTADIEIPPEIDTSLNWLATTDPSIVINFWDIQLVKLKKLVAAAASSQSKWNDLIPREIRGAQKKFKSVAFHQLLSHLNLGGDKWIGQFIFGFPTTGILSQEGVFPHNAKNTIPAQISSLWRTSADRFRQRSRASGFRNAEALWAEAVDQVAQGWLSRPVDLSENGDLPLFSTGNTNVAFRFGVSQGEKLRACDDLRHCLVNACTVILTPITLPTWDHLSQMAKSIHSSGINWSFLKGDHASAYKQLPLDPKFANLTVVALRNPSSGRWMGFVPKVLLFGAVSAVLHYNCFSRALAVVINRFFGIPLVNYYDDFGAFRPSSLAKKALITFTLATNILGSDLNEDKSECGIKLKFLGLTGDFPQISSGMVLSIYLPDDKIQKWSSIVDEILSSGSVQHKPLEKLVGKLCFTQTSIFGRFGRTMLKPLYTKLHSTPYSSVLSDEESSVLRWWASSIRASQPRKVVIKNKYPDVVIYTDAATSTLVIAAIVIEPDVFKTESMFSATFTETADPDWVTIFQGTTLIYGLELLAVIATIFVLRDFLRGKNVTFYVDNSNTKDALVKGFSPTPVINTLIQIFWAFAQCSGALFWFEQIPSGRNIADLPTREVSLPLDSKIQPSFAILGVIKRWVTEIHDKKEYFSFMGNSRR